MTPEEARGFGPGDEENGGGHAYVFIGAGGGRGWWGFTHDPAAADLPADRGPWSFFRNARIDGGGRSAEEAAVLADLAARGFSVRPRD